MTNDYRIMLPLMAATVGSVYVSHRMSPFSIYTLKLQRRGIAFPDREESVGTIKASPPGPPTTAALT